MPFPAKTSTDAIINSAADIIRSGGLASLSMRNLAARLGVRASSLYRHFPDRSAIERSLADRASAQMLNCMQHASSSLMGERALFAAAHAYFDYSTSEASFYDIMMQSCIPGAHLSDATKPIWHFFVGLISETTTINEDISGAAALWSFLHGFIILSRSGQLGEVDLQAAFARGTQALVRGLSIPNAEAVRGQS